MPRALAPVPTASRQREFRDAALARFAHEASVVRTMLRAAGTATLTTPHAQQIVGALVTDLESGALASMWSSALLPLIGDAVTAGGRSVADQLGGDFDHTSRDARNAATDRADAVAGFVGATTANQFLDQYRVVRDAGGTAADLAAAADSSVFDADTTDTRAALVGSLEAGVGLAIGAALAGSLLADQKQWNHSGDPKEPREEHVAIDGEVVDVDDVFSVGLAYPRDPDGDVSQTANCTCSVTYLASDDDDSDESDIDAGDEDGED